MKETNKAKAKPRAKRQSIAKSPSEKHNRQGRNSAENVEKLTQEAVSLLTQGRTAVQITGHFTQLGYSQKTSVDYLTRAYARLRALNPSKMEDLRADFLAKLDQVYHLALTAGDLAQVHKNLDLRMKVYKLDSPPDAAEGPAIVINIRGGDADGK